MLSRLVSITTHMLCFATLFHWKNENISNISSMRKLKSGINFSLPQQVSIIASGTIFHILIFYFFLVLFGVVLSLSSFPPCLVAITLNLHLNSFLIIVWLCTRNLASCVSSLVFKNGKSKRLINKNEIDFFLFLLSLQPRACL